jgi:hypothetical protein
MDTKHKTLIIKQMIAKKKIKIEWIIILLLVFVIIAGIVFVFVNQKKEKQLAVSIPSETSKPIIKESSEIAQKYEKLEQAYKNTLKEIELVISDEDVNLNILKENLRQILETIQQDKELAISNGGNPNTADTQQFQDLLDMSKEVLAERLLEEKEKNEKLTIDNRKLTLNLKKSLTNFEQEKTNNVKLNSEVAQIKGQIKLLKEDGEISINELKSLERQKAEIEKKLNESNKTIRDQNQQIQDLGEIIRKVSLNCYFFYEKGNPEEEAVIFLTNQGISEKYVKYFVRNKPDIYVEFKLSSDFFSFNAEKVELKLFNSLNVEIYSVSKVINSENIKIIIPNKNFTPGKYTIDLKAGDEQLLVDDRYTFKINN